MSGAVRKRENPDCKRELARNPLNAEDRFTFHIEERGLAGRVIDLNSTGALVEFANSKTQDFVIGSVFPGAKLFVNDVLIGNYPQAVVCHVKSESGSNTRVGLFFCETRAPNPAVEAQQRQKGRVRIQDNFLPVGHFENPLIYNDVVHFKLVDVSSTGAKLVTSARNHRILRGQQISDVSIFFPTLTKSIVDLSIEWVRKASSADLIEFGVTFSRKETQFDSVVAQYLLTFGTGESADLRKTIHESGVRTKAAKKTVAYGLVSTPEEYDQVLKLRYLAYSRAGKVSLDETYLKMADQYDSHSHLIIAKHAGRVVGSLRLTSCTEQSHSFELDQSIEVPTHFNRQKTFEASRACVASDFEGTDLIHGLFEFGIQIAVKMKIDWVITSCEEKLLYLYRRLGFRPQGITFELKTLSGIPHIFIAAPLSIVHKSTRLNPIIWHFSFGKVAEFLTKQGFYRRIELSFTQQLIRRVGVFTINVILRFNKRRKK